MSLRLLPEYFAASRQGSEAARPARPMAYVVDTFFLRSSTIAAPVVVGVDAAGELVAVVGEPAPGQMEPSAQRQLSFHGVSQSGRCREVRAESLYLLSLELVEHASSPDELNDPVYLYGSLLGPVGRGERRTKGQLTVTRGDLMEGFLEERRWAFHYSAKGATAACAFHALLPGGNATSLGLGNDMVLAYPLVSLEVADDDLENAGLVQAILSDTIGALRGELARLDHERSTFTRIFSRGISETLQMPGNACLDDCFRLADRSLKLLPGWPSMRAAVLKARVQAQFPGNINGTLLPSTPASAPARSAPVRPNPAQATSARPAAVAAAPRPRLPASTPPGQPPAWMEDFMVERRIGRTATVYSGAQRAPRPADDAAPRERSRTQPAEVQPEWMSDFQPSPDGSVKK